MNTDRLNRFRLRTIAAPWLCLAILGSGCSSNTKTGLHSSGGTAASGGTTAQGGSMVSDGSTGHGGNGGIAGPAVLRRAAAASPAWIPAAPSRPRPRPAPCRAIAGRWSSQPVAALSRMWAWPSRPHAPSPRRLAKTLPAPSTSTRRSRPRMARMRPRGLHRRGVREWPVHDLRHGRWPGCRSGCGTVPSGTDLVLRVHAWNGWLFDRRVSWFRLSPTGRWNERRFFGKLRPGDDPGGM